MVAQGNSMIDKMRAEQILYNICVNQMENLLAGGLKDIHQEEMKNKYYTPAIEDIHIGYECEFHGMTTGGLIILDYNDEAKSEVVKEPNIKVYYPIKCGMDPWSEKKPEQIIELIKTNQIRTSYLTKEQIQSEGWKSEEGFKNVFRKYNDWLTVRFNGNIPIIYIIPIDPSKAEFEHHSRYAGECKSINEFRSIIKLLNI